MTTNNNFKLPRSIIIAGLLVLSACAQPITYAKAGAAPGEWEQDKAACMLQATKEVPVENHYSLTPGQEYSSRNCGNGHKDCSSYATFTPPQIVTTDANGNVRFAVYQGCLAKHGWLAVQG